MLKFFFGDPRCHSDAGNIQVQTVCEFYEPGNIVQGKIMMSLNRDVLANCVKLSLKGKEKAKFIQHIRHDDHTEHVKRHGCHYFLKLENNDFPTGGLLHAGQHEFDF